MPSHDGKFVTLNKLLKQRHNSKLKDIMYFNPYQKAILQ